MAGGAHPGRSCCARLLSLVVTAGFSVLLYWLIFQPRHVRATVVSAALTSLTVANATVSCRLAVVVNVYNPSLRASVYYDALDAELRFRGVFLAANATSPAEFLQRGKSGEDVRLELDGGAAGVPGDVAAELKKEKAAGAVSLDVAVDARVRYKLAGFKIRQKPRIRCSLTVPVKPERSAAGGDAVASASASGDRCSVKY